MTLLFGDERLFGNPFLLQLEGGEGSGGGGQSAQEGNQSDGGAVKGDDESKTGGEQKDSKTEGEGDKESLVKENQKYRKRAQDAEKKFEDLNTKHEDLSKKFDSLKTTIGKAFGFEGTEKTPEELAEDMLNKRKVEEASKTLAERSIIKGEFTARALAAGMAPDDVGDAFILSMAKGLFKEVVIDLEKETVTGVEEVIKNLKKSNPKYFTKEETNPDLGNTGSPPGDSSETPPANIVQLIAKREGLTPEQVIELDNRKKKANKKTGKETTMAERWGISKHFARGEEQ